MMSPRKKSTEVKFDFPAGSTMVSTSKVRMQPMSRVGLYSGSFDPVHAGHIAFSLQAQSVANLDHIFFVPERRPLSNPYAEHYAHRSAMIECAIRPYKQFSLLDLPDKRLTMSSLPRIRKTLPSSTQISLLLGADELLERRASSLPQIFQQLSLIIAVSSDVQLAEVLAHVNAAPTYFRSLQFIDIGRERVSSAVIRSAMRHGHKASGLLPSVWRYARRQWLYISL